MVLRLREVAFEVGEVLVGAHHVGAGQGVGGDAGAQHVDAVEGGFGVDAGLVVGEGEVAGADVEEVVLAHLAPVDDLPDPDADLVGVDEPAGGDRGGDGGQVGVGGREQGGAFPGAFVGQRRVAAGDQPLAGVVGVVISARLCWSNRLSCSGPASAASAATAGARRAVTQPNPPSSRSAAILALVIIPRSPTSTRSVSPNLARTTSTAAVNAVGSAVLPAKTRTATGRPSGSVSSP